jgi:hypothetical protein
MWTVAGQNAPPQEGYMSTVISVCTVYFHQDMVHRDVAIVPLYAYNSAMLGWLIQMETQAHDIHEYMVYVVNLI